MNKDAVISLQNLQIEYDPVVGLPKLNAQASQNFYSLQMAPSIHMTGHASLTGSNQINRINTENC